jgi:murein L,D-transpeptidase YcbB/YkuD
MPTRSVSSITARVLVRLLSVLSLTVDAQVSPPGGLQEALRARIESVREAPATRVVRGSRLLQARAVAAFFEARAFKPAWTGPQDPEAVVAAIRKVDEDGLTPADYHLAAIESLLAARSKTPPAEAEADLQVLLTDAVAALVDHVRYGKVQPVTLDPRWNVDPRVGTPALETTLAELEAAAAPGQAIDALKPSHFIYAGLKKELGRLREVAKAGGWAIVPAGPALKPGVRDPRVILIRKRLAATGELPSSAPLDNDAYDKDVAAAVKLFQERNRFTADGAIGKTTLDALNVSVASRIDQLRINLERARWVVGGLSDSFVLVNLPAYKVYFIRDRKNVWETRAQIGKQARATPAFRADLRYLVLNPDWTVPPGILEDVLAGMRKGQNPIARKKLAILDRQGNTVDPASIDWTKASTRNFGYTLRQPPGPENALGRVKFIFPNEHFVFLHDTPSKEGFAADQRTFSSGCIRVENPLDFASVLLERDGWTRERVQGAIDAGESQTVLLKTPLPVVIVYWTATVGAAGDLHFARDVYNLDANVLRGLDGQADARRAEGAVARSSQ